MTLSQDTLKRLLSYDATTGLFARLVASGNTKIGDIAGGLSKDGIKLSVAGKPYRAHRLAVLYMTGKWPAGDVDHRNSINTDNRWDNLRDVPHAVNMQNMRDANADNSTGLLGVTRANNGLFRARCMVSGVTHQLGCFRTAEEAHAAYVAGKRRLHEGCTI